MSFTARVNETGQLFQATTDLGIDGQDFRDAHSPIDPKKTYLGHLFDAYVSNPAPKIIRFSRVETGTFEGRELEEISFDRLTLTPARK